MNAIDYTSNNDIFTEIKVYCKKRNNIIDLEIKKRQKNSKNGKKIKNPDDVTMEEIFLSMDKQYKKYVAENGLTMYETNKITKTKKIIKSENSENTRNPDDISMDEVYASMNRKIENFDAANIDITYHEMFPIELAKYEFIKPFEVKTQITEGNTIRYIKTDGDISCASIVVGVFNTSNDETLDYFLLATVAKDKTFWRLQPDNYYIFRYSGNIADQILLNKLKKMHEKYETTGKIKLTPQMQRKVLEHMGCTEKEIVLDDKVDFLIDAETNKKKAIYTNKIVSQNNLDEICDDIIIHHNNRKKK